MAVDSTSKTYVVAERLEKALKTVRAALSELDLEVIGELPAGRVRLGHEAPKDDSKVLLVSCPILNFEAMALGQAAAVFFPLHLLVSAEADQTRVSVVNPTELFDGRFPAGASDPMNRLVSRVELALDGLVERGRAQRG